MKKLILISAIAIAIIAVLFWPVKCQKCSATGALSCNSCGGSGRIAISCSSCNGTGSKTETSSCSSCNGSGEAQCYYRTECEHWHMPIMFWIKE